MKQLTATAILVQSPTSTPSPSSAAQQPIFTGLELTPIVVAVVTGVIAGLLAPVLNAYVKERLDREQRKSTRREKTLDEWYRSISELDKIPESLGADNQAVELSNFYVLFNLISNDAQQEFLRKSEEIHQLWEELGQITALWVLSQYAGCEIPPEYEKVFDRIHTHEDWVKYHDKVKDKLHILNREIRHLFLQELARLEDKWKLLH